METSVKIDKPRPTLPDSTTTFLTSSREMEDAASAEAAQAVASLQVSTDLEFNDLFNVTSCSSAESVASEPSFTLIDTFTTDSKITPLKSADFTMLQSSSTNPTLGTASEVMVTSTTLDQPMLEINGSKNAVVSSIVNNDIYTLTLTDGSIVQLRVTNEQPNQLSQLQVVDQNQQNWQQHDRVSPDSFAAEVTVPFDKSSDLMSPTSPVPPAVSPTEVFPAMIPSKRRQTRKSKASYTRSSSVCSEDSKDYYSAASAASEDSDNEDFFNMFSNSMEKVTIESLKAKLSALPEGQTDLGALLVAAKIDLTVEQIVGPPLTTVKKIMEHKGLSEWQMTLCLKIRRRKKNTVSSLNFYACLLLASWTLKRSNDSSVQQQFFVCFHAPATYRQTEISGWSRAVFLFITFWQHLLKVRAKRTGSFFCTFTLVCHVFGPHVFVLLPNMQQHFHGR